MQVSKNRCKEPDLCMPREKYKAQHWKKRLFWSKWKSWLLYKAILLFFFFSEKWEVVYIYCKRNRGEAKKYLTKLKKELSKAA